MESVQIQKQRKGHILLNSRSEYNRCAIPKISSKLGDKEIKTYNKETFEEEKREQIVLDKIKRLRKKEAGEKRRKEGDIEIGKPAKKHRGPVEQGECLGGDDVDVPRGLVEQRRRGNDLVKDD